MRRRIVVLAVLVALLSLGRVVPAQALQSKTYAEYVQAVTALVTGMDSAPGWAEQCQLTSPDALGDLWFIRGASEASIRYHLTYLKTPLDVSATQYGSTTEWMDPVDDSEPLGFRVPLRPKILAQANLPADTAYVSGPYEPWIARYSDRDPAKGFAAFRKNVEDNGVMYGIGFQQDGPGLTINYAPQGGLAGTWMLTDVIGKTVNFTTLVVDATGMLQSSKHWTLESGVETQSVSCTITMSPNPVPDKPNPAITAPLKTIGPVAWRVSNSVLGVAMGKAIRKAVKASGKVTPARVRGQTWIELAARGLQDTWTVADIPQGVKFSLGDPWGGTVARCIKVSKGKLISPRCT